MAQPQQPAKSRVFCDVLEGTEHASSLETSYSNPISTVRASVVGRNQVFPAAFGPRVMCYADYAASGRSLRSIEDYIQQEVLPLYGNTHTTTSITGLQSTCFRHEARQIVGESVNATAEDIVLFTGSGSTGAINKMVQLLGLHLPAENQADPKPVVFVGPFEHHSNLLPWRESRAEVVIVPEDSEGRVDLGQLRTLLERYADRPLKVGSFSAASNVTGILADVDAISATLHRHGALAFWDYASAAPYTAVDMNPLVLTDDRPFVYKDAVFISPHKFPGGPGTPGVLVVKKVLLSNPVPTVPGGGTVFFVTDKDHRYLSNREEREEGGTPDIAGAIRCGLVFHVKRTVGVAAIADAEAAICRTLLSSLSSTPNLVVLGSTSVPRLPILSFLIRAGPRFLHYNFVSALLNDLFGIQTRGGCACAGPYAQSLMGLSRPSARAVEAQLIQQREFLRPGFTRLSLPYYTSAATLRYVVAALKFVASSGWKFLPQYRLNHKSGEWKHRREFGKFKARKWLGHMSLTAPTATAPTATATAPTAAAATAVAGVAAPAIRSETSDAEAAALRQGYLAQAKELAEEAVATGGRGPNTDATLNDQSLMLPPEAQSLSWLFFPSDALTLLKQGKAPPPTPHTTLPTTSAAAATTAANATTGDGDGDGEDKASGEGSTVACIVAGAGDSVGPFNIRTYGATAAAVAASSAAAAATTAAGSSAESNGGEGGSGSGDGDTEMPAASTAAAPSYLIPAASSSSATADCPDGTCSLRTDDFEFDDDVQGAKAAAAGGETPSAAAATGTAAATATDTAADTAAEAAGASGNGLLEARSKKFPLRATGGGGGGAAAAAASAALAVSASRAAGAKSARAKLFPKPPAKVMRKVGQAIAEWDMIREGDRLLLGLSGGKDSLTLLHVLLALQKRSPVKFELACATVDPCTASFDPSPLIPYMKTLGVPYFYLKDEIMSRAAATNPSSICSYCARMKRGLLYSCCRTNGYTTLVLAQHLDDLGESTIMSMLHNGQLRTMKAAYTVDAGDLRVIRPLVYLREAATKQFARAHRLPVINENCPACFEEPKERRRVKKMLAAEESMFPAMYNQMRRSLVPLMDPDIHVALIAAQKKREARTTANRKRYDNGKLRTGGSATGGTKRKKQKQPTTTSKQQLEATQDAPPAAADAAGNGSTALDGGGQAAAAAAPAAASSSSSSSGSPAAAAAAAAAAPVPAVAAGTAAVEGSGSSKRRKLE